jgi:hypothetical protein
MEYNAADIIGRLNDLRGSKISDKDQNEIESWEKGRKLATTVQTEGWPVAIELLQSYVVKSVEQLVATDPADVPSRNANHAISYVASRLLKIFQEDVQSWIELSRRTPTVIKETIASQDRLEL